MELKIKVVCENLPNQDPRESEPIYIGLQRGDEVVEAVPIHTENIVFEPGFLVSPMPNGKTNFLGPYAKGTPSQRFFYLSWVVKNKDKGDTLTMFSRAKIQLSHLLWAQVEQAASSGQGLLVTVSLTDKRGRPRSGTIGGDDLRWG